MKTLCLILLFYVFGLSTVICCWEYNCDDEIKKEYAENHSQDHKENDCNTCSPFFTCGTCSGFVFTMSGVDFKEVPFIKYKFVAFYRSQVTEDFFAKIWEPPKIA